MSSTIGLILVLAILAGIIAIPVLLIKGIIKFIVSLFKDDIEQPTECQPAADSDAEQVVPMVPQVPKEPARHLTASEIMLLIGTGFIVLAAITFVAANWVNMPPAGRVFALICAGILSYGISIVMHKALKLERTSASFYGIGSVMMAISFLTAGVYEEFGSAFSPDGELRYLFQCFFLLLIAAAALMSYFIYKKNASFYWGFGFISAAVVALCAQIGVESNVFEFLLVLVQFMMTICVHVWRPQGDAVFARPLSVVAKVSAVVYDCFAFVYVLRTTDSADLCTYLIIGMIMVQLIFYGIYKKKTFMLTAANLLACYADLVICTSNADSLTEPVAMLLFGFIAAAIYAVNRFIPGTPRKCSLVALGIMILGAIVSLSSGCDTWQLGIIIPVIASLAITEYVLHNSKGVQSLFGAVAPILPFFTACYTVSCMLGNSKYKEMPAPTAEIKTFVFGALAVVYIAAAAFFLYLPKIKFELHAKHPAKSSAVIYANMAWAGAICLNISRYSEIFIIAAAVCVLHIIMSGRLKINIVGMASVISLCILTYSIAEHYIGIGTYPEYNSGMVDYILFGTFIVLAAASKFLYPESVCKKDEDTLKFDILGLSAPIFVLLYPSMNRTGTFLRLMTGAIFLAVMVKRDMSKKGGALVLSVSAALGMIALFCRPFLLPESDLVKVKVNLAIVVLLGIAYKFIWREFPETSKKLSTAIFVLAFIRLIIDGLVNDSAANKIFVLGVTAAILLISFFVKSKTWFTSSSAALVIITVFSTWRYFDKAGWWLYLLIVGIVFVVIAAVNEACKKNGETMKSKVTKVFSDWTW